MNYYPFHIGDYLSATRHLSWEEDAAFRRLLDTYYTTEKPLPADLRQVCRLVLATTESQRQAVETVLGEFFQLTDFGWVNTRADIEIIAMREKQQKQRDRVNKRWDKVRSERGIASDSAKHDSGIAVESEIDTAVSNIDTNVLPPTPTPTPTPTPITAKAVERVPRKKQQVALPDDFGPNENGMLKAKERGLDVASELEKFKNHHLAKASVMADWQAAWRIWIGNARAPVFASQNHLVQSENPRPKWAIDAGFANVWEANNARCYPKNAHEFRNGKRILQVVA